MIVISAMPAWSAAFPSSDIHLLIMLLISLPGAIAAYKMRRRIKRNLGRDATETDMTSLKTWMDVEDAERDKRKNTPLG